MKTFCANCIDGSPFKEIPRYSLKSNEYQMYTYCEKCARQVEKSGKCEPPYVKPVGLAVRKMLPTLEELDRRAPALWSKKK